MSYILVIIIIIINIILVIIMIIIITMQSYGDRSGEAMDDAPKSFKKRSWQGSEDAILRGLVSFPISPFPLIPAYLAMYVD